MPGTLRRRTHSAAGSGRTGPAQKTGSEIMQISTVDRRDGQRGTILVYDEDGPLLDVVVRMLRRDGIEVTATPSGREAMDLARSGHFDLVIVDLDRRWPNAP